MALNKTLKMLATAGLVVAASAYAQEPIAGAGIKPIQIKSFSPVNQAMLDKAGKDANNWLLCPALPGSQG